MVEGCSHKAVVESSSLSISTGYNNMNKGLGSKILELYSKGYATLCEYYRIVINNSGIGIPRVL